MSELQILINITFPSDCVISQRLDGRIDWFKREKGGVRWTGGEMNACFKYLRYAGSRGLAGWQLWLAGIR